METNNTTKPVFVRILLGSITAGIVAAVLNNLYNLIYSGTSVPQLINFRSITLVSIAPSILAGLCYFVLSRFTHNATRIFVICTLVLMVLSFMSTMPVQLPDGTPTPKGFTGLTLPMHLITGLAIAFIIPRFVKNKN